MISCRHPQFSINNESLFLKMALNYCLINLHPSSAGHWGVRATLKRHQSADVILYCRFLFSRLPFDRLGGLNVLRRPSASQTSECGERDRETMPLAWAPHGSICLFSARYLWRLLEMQRGLRVRNAAPRVSLTHFPSSHLVSSRPAYVCVRSRKRILARHWKKKKKKETARCFNL